MPPSPRSSVTPPGTMRSIISLWPKQTCCRACVAQHAAFGIDQRERGVVADGADIAEMIGEALKLGHQRAQPDRALRQADL